MKTIWKYDVPLDVDDFTLDVPEGSEILCLKTQNNIPHLWFLIDVANINKLETRTFYIQETEYSFQDYNKMKYVGTFMMRQDRLVWHLFEYI